MRFIELEENRTCCFKYITMMCRVCGILVVIFLYIMMISILTEEKYHTINGWYLLGITILIMFLEVLWVFDKCNCCDDMSCCCMVWRAIKWVDCWRKTILYTALPIPLFLRNVDESVSILKAVLCGVMIICLGLLYFVKSFRNTTFAKTNNTALSYMELQGEAGSQMAVPPAPPMVTGTVPQQQYQQQLQPGPATALTSASPAPPPYVPEAPAEKADKRPGDAK